MCDALARRQGLSPTERLAYHQQHSGPIMASIQTWLAQQLDDHLVEPNSGLGEAIRYMQRHWEKLTRFLHVAGTPLANGLCERTLLHQAKQVAQTPADWMPWNDRDTLGRNGDPKATLSPKP